MICIYKRRKIFNMMFRNNKIMNGSLRSNVFNNNNIFIFGNNLSRKLFRNNLTENTINHEFP